MKKNLLFILSISLMLTNVSGQLSGTYSIDPGLSPSGTNYTSINSALGDLTNGIRPDGGPINGFGVDGPVIFNIADGDYNEVLYLTTVYNSSTTNTITFQSASLDSNSVRIYSETSNVNNNAVIYFNGADYFKFKYLTVDVSLKTGTSFAIYINGGSNNNIISNCILKGVSTSSTSNNYTTLFHNGTSNDNEYSNNLVVAGSYGMYIPNGNRNLIKGNIFKNQYTHALYMYRNYDSKIISNLFTEPNNSNSYAMYLYQNYDSTHVIGNVVDGDFYMGLRMRNNYGKSAQPTIVANNMIHLGERSTGKYGIYCDYSNYTQFYYNSINLKNNSSNARCFYQYSGTANSMRLQNNNFVSEYGPAVYINTTSTIELSDNNNFYSENYNLGYWSGWRSNLSNWQSVSSEDANSISVDPRFLSSSDLHTYDVALDTLGTIVNAILTDIDGELRDALKPDIGADEFTKLSNDAEIISIDSIDIPICSGANDVFVTIYNYGTDTLTSLTILTELNNTAAVNYAWSGSLLSNSSTSVNIGSFDFANDTVQNIHLYCMLPNAVQDSNTSNDSLSIEFTTALTGNYTIGGADPDFENIKDAATALSDYGICGQTVFNIRDGIYEEHIQLNEIPGTSELNTVLFQSESSDSSKVIIQSDYSDYAIRYNGADFVTFKQVSIEQSNSGNVLEFLNNSNKNQILNCRLNGYISESSNTSYAIVYGNSSINDSNVFKNNILINGSYGIYYQGYSSGNLETGAHIENNIFSNQYYSGIYLAYQDAPKIVNNYLSTQTHYGNFLGINLYYCDNDLEISNNKIFKAYLGVEVEYCDAIIGNESIISNNYIQTGGNGPSSGLVISNTSNLNIYFNSIYTLGTNSSATAFNNSGGSNLRILNNIFSSESGYAYYINSPAAIDSSEHNNYFSATGNLAYWNGNQSDLASLRTENGMDIKSYSVFPNFVSDTNLVIKNLLLNNSGLPLTDVTKDINGTLRSILTPDIGATEFDVTGTVDAAVLEVFSEAVAPACPDYYNVYSLLVNNSLDTLFTCNLKWELNGIAQTAVVYNDTLLTGEKVNLLIDSILFVEGTDYKVNVWSDMPNGVVDAITENDSAQTNLYAGLNGTYTLGGTNPDFEDFTELANHLDIGGLCGPSIVNIRDGVYTEQITINSVVGSSANNHLTIQSETGVSTNVILEWASDYYADNYTLGLFGTDYITIRNITIKALDPEYGVVVIMEGNDSLIFTGNTFSGNLETIEDSDNLDLLHSSNNNGSDKHFIDNKFIGGNHALYLDGSGVISGTIISQNEISNSFSGIYINDDFSPDISGNTISAKISGLYVNDVDDNFTISKNRIVVTGIDNNYDVYGLQINNCNADTGIVSNNFISNTNTYDVSSYGVYLNSSSNVNMAFNNVRNSNPYSYNSALRISNGGSNVIKNNILANTGTGYAVYSNGDYDSNVDTSDNNDYFTQGNYIFYTNGYDIPSLKMLRFVTGDNNLDSNSVVVDPLFNSATDLHVNEISLNGIGKPVNLIKDDIDGELRNITTPDIGADEFNVFNADAAATEVSTSEKFICDGTYTIYSFVRNLGLSSLTTCTVNWSIDGISQTAYSWSGSLASGQVSDTLFLGTYNFVAANNQAFELKVWTSQPNGGADEKSANDTVTYLLYPGISGSFTIGKNGTEDFASFREAKDYLMNAGGVCSPVVFNVSDGIYEEYIEIGEIAGTSDTNTITFQAASNDASLVTITYNGGDNYDAVVGLDGSDYIVFKNVTIEQTSSSDYCIQFENGATNNLITGCILKNSDNGYGIYTDNWYDIEDNDNSFINNKFLDGDYGIYWYGWNDDDIIETGLIIKNNEFLNQEEYAIYVEYCDSVIVRDNYIINSAEATGYEYAMYIYQEYSPGYFEVVNNEIIMHEGQEGITIEYANGYTNRPSQIVNNSISINTNQNYVYGIYTYESANINVLHNTVSIVNAGNESYVFYIDYGASINILNNIFVNQAGGYAYYYDWPPYSISSSDYNTIYSSGSSAFYHDNIGSLSDLAAWHAYTGFDAHSLEIMPSFIADDDLRLCDAALDNKGIYFASVPTDLEGDIRDTLTPDIGADEYTALANFDLGGTVSLCNAPITLDAGPINGTYLWSTGDTTRTITVTSTGNYTVTVTTDCGNTSDAVQVIESIDVPIAGFSSEISFLTAAFSNTSSNAVSYLWDFGDGNISTEKNPTHLYATNDSYTVSLKSENSCKADSTESVIEITYTSLEESDFAEVVEIYPNPNDGVFSIDFNLENLENVNIQIFNIAGNLVYSDTYYQVGLSNQQIDISNYPSGNYTIVLSIDNTYMTYQTIID